MKTKRIITLFLILFNSFIFAQEKLEKDMLLTPKKRTFILGVDVLNAGIATFSNTKMIQGFIAYRITKNIEAVADVGFSKNKYDKNGYDASATGFFVKAGANYTLLSDSQNPYDIFYAGGKLGGSFYQQEYYKIPVRGVVVGDYYEALPKSSQSSYWIETTLGGRVELFQSRFLVDVQVQPRYLLYTTKQESVKPMVVPGFGKASTQFNMGFTWSVAYRF